jgi:hypothetical protein
MAKAKERKSSTLEAREQRLKQQLAEIDTRKKIRDLRASLKKSK